MIRDTVRKYLPDESYRVFIFGSRAKESNRKWSDVDVGVEGPEKVPLEALLQIKGDLAESNTPYRVDVVDFASTSEDFKNATKKSIIYL